MATVPDLATGWQTLDVSYARINRTIAAAPNGTLTPRHSGELVQDTSTGNVWRALSTANNTWSQVVQVA